MKFLVLLFLGLAAVESGYVYRTHSPLVLPGYHPLGYNYNYAAAATPLLKTYSPYYATAPVVAAAPAPPAYFKYGYSVPHTQATVVKEVAAAPILKTLAADVVPAAVAPSPADLVVAKTYAPAYGAKSQYHEQNEAGEYNFGYVSDNAARQETRRADGVVTGQYSYVDSNNIPQQVNYVADALGFRVQATNLPVDSNTPVVAPAVVAPVAGPAVVAAPLLKSTVVVDEANPHVPYTPEVAHARAAHLRALQDAHTRSKRSAKWGGSVRSSWGRSSPSLWNRGSWSRGSSWRRGGWSRGSPRGRW